MRWTTYLNLKEKYGMQVSSVELCLYKLYLDLWVWLLKIDAIFQGQTLVMSSLRTINLYLTRVSLPHLTFGILNTSCLTFEVSYVA